MSGHASSINVHRARLLKISRSSLANSGQIGALRAHVVSGEGKKDGLQICGRPVGSAAQLVEGTEAANSTVCQERKTITDLLGIPPLMDRQGQRAAGGCHAPQDTHHVASLPQV